MRTSYYFGKGISNGMQGDYVEIASVADYLS